MSNPARRILNDYYPTPTPITDLLLGQTNIRGSVFEPCAGHNAITKVLANWSLITSVSASDLLWDITEGHTTNDATTSVFWSEWGVHSWIITNPPFSEAEQILPLAFEHCNHGVAFLLRLSYLEPCNGRGNWLRDHADHLKQVIVVNPRIKFRADTKGTDSVTCAWFIWDKRFSWDALGVHCPFIFASNWQEVTAEVGLKLASKESRCC
ncbi:hypothetical protein [Acaryochloris sp. IP29b_bin.137]|uniref:hypothetical protein n=1 Tax=Acaryochloris sp. IP29b_bin.137 TaxID=2969217 RepID=UPI0026063FD9|nr:hypothetical protein [Acaryochloris sp. IP29b_bin.137]